MSKLIYKTTLLLIVLFFTVSCTDNYKIAYVNLVKVYKSRPKFKVLDSLYNARLVGLNNYALTSEQKLKNSKLAKDTLEKKVKAYRDTINAYRQQIETDYANKVNLEKNKIQKVIDSISTLNKYNYVLSTANNNILFVKDTTNNITQSIIKALK